MAAFAHSFLPVTREYQGENGAGASASWFRPNVGGGPIQKSLGLSFKCGANEIMKASIRANLVSSAFRI
jgi:hypothetical protein